jgi:hypothetical protein
VAPMTTRRAVLVGILVGVLVGIGIASLAWIVADRNRQPEHPPAAAPTTISPGATQPTIPPPPTVTALAATSSTVMATGKTTRDPNTFTTGTVAGPIQVRVIGESSCQGTAGQGWRVRYQVTNDGPGRTGPVLAQVDLQPPVQLKPTLTLGPGGRHEETVLLVGSGELVTVTWQGVTSFPMEVEACPPNPADEPAAGQVTTTT